MPAYDNGGTLPAAASVACNSGEPLPVRTLEEWRQVYEAERPEAARQVDRILARRRADSQLATDAHPGGAT